MPTCRDTTISTRAQRRIDDRSTVVYLVRNPWHDTIPDFMLIGMIKDAARKVHRKINAWEAEGKIEPGRDSFALTVFDPTKPRGVKTVSDMVIAIILFGPTPRQFIANGAAKIDITERHGVNNGVLVESANFRLGDDEFAWGYSGEFSGGSGYTAEQDRKLALRFERSLARDVTKYRADYIARERAHKPSGHRWYNRGNRPPHRYSAVAQLLKAKDTISEVAD